MALSVATEAFDVVLLAFFFWTWARPHLSSVVFISDEFDHDNGSIECDSHSGGSGNGAQYRLIRRLQNRCVLGVRHAFDHRGKLLARLASLSKCFVHIIILVATRQLESLFQIHQVLPRVPLKQHFQRIQYIFGPPAFDVLKADFESDGTIRCLMIASSVRPGIFDVRWLILLTSGPDNSCRRKVF